MTLLALPRAAGMLPAAIAALAPALLSGCGEPAPPPRRDPDLARWAAATIEEASRTPLERRSTTRIVARVVFDGLADRPHDFVATFSDGRSRVELGLPDADPSRRSYEYQVDGRVFVREPGAASSRELTARDSEQVLARNDARERAWSLGADSAAGICARRGEFSVEVVQAADAPDRVDLIDGAGAVLESWRVLARDGDGLPRQLAWTSGDRPVWIATLVERHADASYGERYYWPPDRWEGSVQAVNDPVRAERAPRTVLRVDLEASAREDWSAAFDAIEVRRAELAARLGPDTLDGRPAFVVGASGRPLAIEFGLRPGLAAPDASWVARTRATGVSLRLERADRCGPAALERLMAASGASGPVESLLQPTGGAEDPADLFLASGDPPR
jgi:hypothetical protein